MKPPFFEPLIAAFSPKTALAREAHRSKLQRAYDGAAKGRRTQDWRATGTSATTEVQQAKAWLRNRSRELARNNAYQANIVYRLLPNNIIGTGILPTPIYTGPTGKADSATAKKVNERVKAQWKAWADELACDYDGRLNFYGLQHLIVKSWAESGECFILKKYNTTLPFPLQLQVLEGDYLDMRQHDLVRPTDGSNRKFYGIEFDSRNQRVAYWFYPYHPADSGSLVVGTSTIYAYGESIRVPAEDVIHIYEVHRPTQTFGVPGSSPIMMRLRDLDKFEDAELSKQMVAACYAAFVTKDEGDPATADAATGQVIDRMEPGMIEMLRPGESVTFGTPPVNNGFESYTRNTQRTIATGSGVTYEGMTGDLSNVNFSSGRMGWLEFQRNVSQWQWNMLIPHFGRLWGWFIDTAAIMGVLPMGTTVPVSWTPPRREMIDPVKEWGALDAAVRSGFKSWQSVVKENGDNPEEMLQQLKEDHDNFVSAGLFPASDPAFDTERIVADAAAKKTELMKDEGTIKPKTEK